MVEAIVSRDRLSAVACERGAVLGPGDGAVAFHGRQVQQHREPGRALDQGPDRGAVQPDDQVSFPVAGHGPVRGLGGPLADHDPGCHELLAAAACAGPGDAKRPAGAQARCQLAPQRSAALDVQGLVDRLVGDPHGLIIGEVGPEPVRDLLRAPRRGPAPVGPAPVAPSDPPHVRAPAQLRHLAW
jgi:hypothetical protein